MLKYVVEELDNYEWPFLHSLALQLYGSWMKETKSETASDIIKKYFQKVIKTKYENYTVIINYILIKKSYNL